MLLSTVDRSTVDNFNNAYIFSTVSYVSYNVKHTISCCLPTLKKKDKHVSYKEINPGLKILFLNNFHLFIINYIRRTCLSVGMSISCTLCNI